MSLRAASYSAASPDNGAIMVKLRTSDQYDLWRARIADDCWAKTGKDLFSIDEDDCDTALLALAGGDEEERRLYDWLVA